MTGWTGSGTDKGSLGSEPCRRQAKRRHTRQSRRVNVFCDNVDEFTKSFDEWLKAAAAELGGA